MTNKILVDKKGAITLLTINRPEVYNAIDAETAGELGNLLDIADNDNDVRVVIITGAGPKAFCAGFDLAYAESNPAVYDDPLFGSEVVRRAPGKPRIAAVNGVAAGLGFEIALACDLIIASSNARFSLPEARVGLAAMGGGVARLTRTIGEKQSLGITLTCRQVPAQEGKNLGFINDISESDVVDLALKWATQMAECGPLSLAATQEMTRLSQNLDLEEALDPLNYPAVKTLLKSNDSIEGRRAFLEKRQPQWKNR